MEDSGFDLKAGDFDLKAGDFDLKVEIADLMELETNTAASLLK